MTVRTQTLLVAAAVLLAAGGRLVLGTHASAATDPPPAMGHMAVTSPPSVRGELPTEAAAKGLLDIMGRHREWAEVPAGASVIRAYVVYPDRANKAPVVLVTSRVLGMTDWVRAVSDQVAADGFIAVAPDLRGDDVARQANVVRDYIDGRVPLANGTFASLDLAPNADGTTRVDIAVAAEPASFIVTPETWSTAVHFLNRATNNRPDGLPSEADMHMQYMDMTAMTMSDVLAMSPAAGAAMDLAEAQVQAHGRGENSDREPTTTKRPDLPASVYTSRQTMRNTTMKGEWIYTPVDGCQVRSWVTYPEGTGPAPVVLFFHGAPGMWEDFPQAVSDQLAREGFIGVALDLRSCQGPNGGYFDWHFPHLDDGTPPSPEVAAGLPLKRAMAVREHALKLPRANGKSATLGLCAGGGLSWQMAINVPALNAAVSMYGGPPSDEALLAKINAPVYAFQGDYDGRLAVQAPIVAATMKKLGKEFHYVNYPRVTHGYLTNQNIANNFQAVVDSWPKAMTFIRENTK